MSESESMSGHPNVSVVAPWCHCHLHIHVTLHLALHLPNRFQKINKKLNELINVIILEQQSLDFHRACAVNVAADWVLFQKREVLFDVSTRQYRTQRKSWASLKTRI